VIIDSATLDPVHAYKLLIGSILPRAIGWISTLSKGGIANLAPISFFTGTGRRRRPTNSLKWGSRRRPVSLFVLQESPVRRSRWNAAYTKSSLSARSAIT
jgi:hypothetical protein